ncbi:MAG: TolC family protein, partial [Ignavibacteria bacterium]|nr:TolC family protein [Ignavibacteria bacterium]
MKHFKTLFLVLILSNLITYSQSKKIITNLTLEKAIEIALKENSQIKIARLELEKSESKLTEAYSSLYPSISGEGSYIRNIKKPVFFLPDFFGRTTEVQPIEIGAKNSYSAVLKIGLPIFIGQTYSGIVIGKLGLELNAVSLEETIAQTKLNTSKAFYDVLLSRETEKFVKKSYENALSNLRNAEKLNKVGMLSDFELLSAQVEVEKIKPNILQAEYAYHTALNFLKTLMNLSSADSIEVIGSFEAQPLTKKSTSIDSSVVDNSYSLMKLNLQKQIAEKNIMLQKWGHIPSLTAFGNYQVQTQTEDYEFDKYRWVKSSSVGLTLSVPIFAGFNVTSKVEQAEINHQQIEETINLTRKQLDIAISNTKNRLETAREKIEAQKINREKALRNYQIAETRYKEGVSNQLEVSNANL